MQKIIVLTLAVIWLAEMGCQKNSAPPPVPSGVYLELTPDSAGTTLNFISAGEVTVMGGSLSNQELRVDQSLSFSITGGRIYFISDSADIRDSTAFFIEMHSDTLQMSTCPPGVPCAAWGYFYIFKKQ